MRLTTLVGPSVLSSALVLLPAPAQDRPRVVVYGGSSAGVVAAVTAARLGADAVLVAPTRHVGGLTTSGLGATDVGNEAAIGGTARELYRRLRRHYDRPEAWPLQRPEDFRGRGHRPGSDTAWTFEPHVAERVLEEMLAESGIEVLREERLELRDGADLDGARIVAIRTESGRELRADMFVDASYEGDLLAEAGVSYTVGREANHTFDETLNGVQTARAVHHQFIVPVDPWIVPGDRSSGLLPGIEPTPPGPDGNADHRVQAYCFRLCLTDVAENRRPWEEPPDYDERRYELLLRNFEAGDRRVPWHHVRLPNGKTDTNNNHAISTDHIGGSWRWPEADHETRTEIAADHESWQRGLLWTLASHPRVPAAVREEVQRWGLARDEFTDNDNWPWRLYVREGRRMVTDTVMTERHCRGLERVPDPVGLGSYGMDSHNVQRYVDRDGHVRNEGDVQVHGFAPYGISFRAVVPRREECTNLAVPVCVAATHIAYGSIRMEPVFMVLGQSAATAAVLAARAGVPLQDLPYEDLRRQLEEDGQVLVPDAAGTDPASLPGIVVDDGSARAEGAWTTSTSQRPFLGAGYRHDGNAQKGERSLRFSVALPAAGDWEVRLAYTPHANRASNVPVTIETGGGPVARTVDQRREPPLERLWVSLGVHRLQSPHVEVVVSNDGTDGYVVVDGLWLLRVQ